MSPISPKWGLHVLLEISQDPGDPTQLTEAATRDQEMEEWWQTFQELIEEEKPRHRWTLTRDRNITPDLLQPNWKQYQQQVFAR